MKMITDDELHLFYKNTCNTRQVSFSEFKENYFMSQPKVTPPNDAPLVTELEHVFTIDGRGRPKKCKLLLELFNRYGSEKVIETISVMSERKFI